MVKGVSKQVIVVQSPDRKLFEQAIFILKEDMTGVTDAMLLKEAQKALHPPARVGKKPNRLYGPVCACGGAAIMGLVWLLTLLF